MNLQGEAGKYSTSFDTCWNLIISWNNSLSKHHSLRVVVLRLSPSCGMLLSTFRQHIPTIKSHAAHVAFYIWRHAGKPRYNAHSCARIVSSILSAQSVPDIYAFVSDAVPAVVGQENPLEVFSDALLAVDQELLQPAQLERHLSLAMFVLPGTELPVGIPAETRQKALYALANVFQRYQCNGDMSGVPYAPRGISQAILECFQRVLIFSSRISMD